MTAFLGFPPAFKMESHTLHKAIPNFQSVVLCTELHRNLASPSRSEADIVLWVLYGKWREPQKGGIQVFPRAAVVVQGRPLLDSLMSPRKVMASGVGWKGGWTSQRSEGDG